MAYENRLIASSHRSHMFLRSAKVRRRLHIPEIVHGARGIYQHNVGVVSRFSAVDVPATRGPRYESWSGCSAANAGRSDPDIRLPINR
jgi:hypothetical protein